MPVGQPVFGHTFTPLSLRRLGRRFPAVPWDRVPWRSETSSHLLPKPATTLPQKRKFARRNEEKRKCQVTMPPNGRSATGNGIMLEKKRARAVDVPPRRRTLLAKPLFVYPTCLPGSACEARAPHTRSRTWPPGCPARPPRWQRPCTWEARALGSDGAARARRWQRIPPRHRQ